MSDVYGTIAQGVNPLQMAGQAMQIRTSQQQLLNQQQQLQANQFALQQAKLQPAYAGIMALRDNPNAGWGDIQHALAQSERLGADVSGLTQNANEMMAQGGTPADYIKSTSLRGMPAWEQFGVVGLTAEQLNQPMQIPDPTGRGSPITVSLGYAIQHGLWNPGTGAGGGYGGGGGGMVPSGGGGFSQPAAPSGLPKEQFLSYVQQRESGGQNIRTRILNPQTGQPASTASGLYQILDSTWQEGKQLAGIDSNQYPTAMSAPPEVQHQVAGALYDKYGETPWAQSAPRGPTQAPYQVASSGPVAPPTAAPAAPDFYGQTGGVIRQVPPGTGEMIKGSVGRAQDLIASQNQTLATRAILAGMETDLNTRGFVSGTGSSSFGTMRQLLQTAGIAPEAIDIKQGQAAQEQFQKFSYQLQAQQMRMLGAASDARQEMSEASNPSMHLSVAGNLKIVHMLMGNQQAIDVMSRAYSAAQASGQVTPGGFDTWRQQFTAKDRATGGEFDPRVFWLANMSPAEQQEYAKTTQRANAREWAQLSNNLQYAKNQGWISQQGDGSIGSEW